MLLHIDAMCTFTLQCFPQDKKEGGGEVGGGGGGGGGIEHPPPPPFPIPLCGKHCVIMWALPIHLC